MNPYHQLVTEYARFAREGKSYPLGKFPPAPRPAAKPDASKVLIFAPHPDDECIIGALPLRLLREAGMTVIDVAVTLGSAPARQAERFRELQNACQFIGYGLVPTRPNGLERVHVKTRDQDRRAWNEAVSIVARILVEQRPRVAFFPHEKDWNTTHVGTHFLVMDALQTLGPDFDCFLVETEYWEAMADPNLMVESSVADVADLVTATSFHIGEVRRNPFHLVQPAWMQDNVRRGSELVGGQGQAAPDFTFATLYRLRRWTRGAPQNVLDRGRQLSVRENPAMLFA